MDYTKLASKNTVEKTLEALKIHGFQPLFIETGKEALLMIQKLIPAGASVMNGSSRTLEEIGFVEYLKAGQHGWNNLHANILAEKDTERQKELRKYSVVSDYYLGSAHAVTEGGEIVVASNSGSQMPHLVFTSPNIVLVVSTKKIVPTLSDAFERIDKCIMPLEDVSIQKKFGVHTIHAKTLIMHKENPMMGRKVHVIFVNEKLGF